MRQLHILHKIYFLSRCLSGNQFLYGIQHLIYIERNRLQFHLAALYLGHIQNIIDQSQQVIGRRLYFLQAVQNPFLALALLQRNSRHTDDTVHGSTDFMAHTGQKLRLGLAGNIMLHLIQLRLYHLSKLRQIMISFLIFQKLRRNAENADISHITSVVVHGQHDTLLPRCQTQKAL